MKKEYADIITSMGDCYDYDVFVEKCNAVNLYPMSFQGWAQTLGMCLFISHAMPGKSFEDGKMEIFSRYEKPATTGIANNGKPCCGGGKVL